MFIDHTGEKHGLLLIIGYEGQGRVMWICKCDCGRETRKSYNSLLQYLRLGTIASCGCVNNSLTLDLIGKRFGQLLVKDRLKQGWLCLCDCGKELVVRRGYNLHSRNTNSCGCIKHYLGQPATVLEDRTIMYSNKNLVPFFIDHEDYESVSRYSWRIEVYPVANIRLYVNGSCVGRRNIHLHEFLLGKAPEGLECDHINRNPLDNRRKNLHFVTHVTNVMNVGLRQNNTTGNRGVYYCGSKWLAVICDKPNHRIDLGRFDTFEEAVAARKAAELKYYGELCKDSIELENL